MRFLMMFALLCLATVNINSALASSNCVLTGSENPEYNFSINPGYNFSLNPEHNFSINPGYTSTVDFLLCDQQQNLIGAANYASTDIAVLFKNDEWIGYTVSNDDDGFNLFGLGGEWIGYFVPPGQETMLVLILTEIGFLRLLDGSPLRLFHLWTFLS